MKRRKRILLTGATSGIGKAAALKFAEQGHHVIIHGRNLDKAEATRQAILASVPGAQIDLLTADLSRKSDILNMAETFNNRYDGLDVLINNAGGVMNKQREETIDGWEKTIAINVLAPYILSALLYPQLQLQPGGHIINTASMAHRMAEADIDDLMSTQRYNATKAYGDAKLYIILLGQEFVRRQRDHSDHPVAMNAFHPGVVATNFAVESNSFYHYFFKLFRPFLASVEQGADTMVYLTNQDDNLKHNGSYFVKRKLAKVHEPKNAQQIAKKLWEQAEKITGISFL